jgi:hypothetical protein
MTAARIATDQLTRALLGSTRRTRPLLRPHVTSPVVERARERESHRHPAVRPLPSPHRLPRHRRTKTRDLGIWGGRDSRAGQGLSQRTGAAPLARLVHERSALDDFEVLAGGLILVEMAEGD